MSLKQTQCSRILEFIKVHGSINPKQAEESLGVMRLASRVSDLRQMGHLIGKRTVTAKNRFGETTHYAEYFIQEESNE